ncbi:MAG TPA: sialidase family protein, partial [Armatimonadota bacterium]|nr:sialidase family protein [Armatimonadota bacterium]
MASYLYISGLSAGTVGALGAPGQGAPPAVVEEEGLIKTRLLPPGPGNPRNSEGAFIQLNDGRVLFVYTHFTGGGWDHAAAHLAGRFSSDGGRTWCLDDVLILPNEGEMNVMSVSLLRLQSGAIALFYLRKNSERDCHLYMRLSTDEARSWG